MEFCDEKGCQDWAQSSDPTEGNTLKYKCVMHEAAARARGETGIRRAPPDSSELHNLTPDPDAAAEQQARYTAQAQARAAKETAKRNAAVSARPVFEMTPAGVALRRFESMKAAAGALGFTDNQLERLIQEKTVVDDDAGTYYTHDAPARGGALQAPRPERVKKAVQLMAEDGTVETTFPSADVAAEILKSTRTAVQKACHDRRRVQGRAVRYMDGAADWSMPAATPMGRKGQLVEELDAQGKVIAIFNNLRLAGDSAGVSIAAVQRGIQAGRAVAGRMFRRAGETAIETADARPAVPEPEPEIQEIIMPQVKCVETEQVFDGVVDAAKSVGLAKGSLYAALAPKGSGKAGGKHWKYTEEPAGKSHPVDDKVTKPVRGHGGDAPSTALVTQRAAPAIAMSGTAKVGGVEVSLPAALAGLGCMAAGIGTLALTALKIRGNAEGWELEVGKVEVVRG